MIAMIGAMQLEIDLLLEEMTQREERTIAAMTFHTGRLGGRDTVVVRSGVGKVNAAICAQILCDVFAADAIINTGIAGALAPQVGLGDLVLSQDALEHDMDAQGFGYAPGVIPQMDCSVFTADPALLALAQRCAAHLGITSHTGRVLTGDQFISDRAKKNSLHAAFGGLCVEMEGAAIAHTAYLSGVPFLIVRSISDNADDTATVDYPSFEQAAARQSTQLVLELLAQL